MTDADTLKTIVQGGSFAVLVVILVWIMFKLEPRMSSMISTKDAEHAATIAKIVEESRVATEALVTRLTDMVQKAHDDCREDRKERDDMMAKESKMNRDARHDDADKWTATVAEMYNRTHGVVPNSKP